MAAWRDMADDHYDVCESYGQHVSVEAFYPELTLADLDKPELTPPHVTREGLTAGSSPAHGYQEDAA